jgi:hypothetical protein
MTRNESASGEVRCDQCNRLVALVRPDGALEVRVRHGGEKHTTVVRSPEPRWAAGAQANDAV